MQHERSANPLKAEIGFGLVLCIECYCVDHFWYGYRNL